MILMSLAWWISLFSYLNIGFSFPRFPFYQIVRLLDLVKSQMTW